MLKYEFKKDVREQQIEKLHFAPAVSRVLHLLLMPHKNPGGAPFSYFYL